MNKYNHLNLIQENINLDRQGRQDRRGVRKVIPSLHGKSLNDKFSQRKNEFKSRKKINEDFIFTIIRDSDKPINYEKLGLRLLAEVKKNRSIVEVENEHIFNLNLNDFTAEKIAQKNVVNYTDFANIDEFVFQTPEDKKGPLLKNANIIYSKHYILDIQLYIGEENLKSIHKKVSSFKKYLSEIKCKVMDDCIMLNLVIIKVEVKGEEINTLLEHNNIYFADLPQRSIYSFSGNRENILLNLPKVIPPPNNAPYIGVIDSGILPTHPLLKGSIAESEAFGNLDTPYDENGHGTMITGIIQYGDVYNSVKNTGKNPLSIPFNILNARVTDKNNSFPEDKILASVVKEAIEYYASSADYKCNIFNISLGDDRIPYTPSTKMDHWSYVLDELIHKYNLVIVVSSGNYSPRINNERIIDLYIDDLLNDETARLIPPSLGISCLTIGSKAKDDIPYSSYKDVSHVPIAKKEHISPFSRIGLGYNNSIKPETIAYGGNYSLNTGIKRINTNDRNLGIFSTSIFDEKTGSWFETRSGTSFAAPYITHLLGKIKYQIPSAKGNLLRALLINTSSYNNENVKALNEKLSKGTKLKPSEINETIKKVTGYGEVREQYLVNSFDHYVTMYYEGKIGVDKVNVFEVPIPDDIYTIKGKSKIHITLVYNPPVKDSRIDYNGTKMSFDLYRGLPLEDIKKYTCKPDTGIDDFEKDKLPDDKKKFKCKLFPSITDISRGTVLKATHEITTRGKAKEIYGNTFNLVVRCARRWYQSEDPQEYAVVVSIEHENESSQLYSYIQSRIQSKTRRQLRSRT